MAFNRSKTGKILLLTAAVGVGLVVALEALAGLSETSTVIGGYEVAGINQPAKVLGVTDEGFFTADNLVFRIATRFEDVLSARVLEVDERLSIGGEIELAGPITISNNINAEGVLLDLGEGSIVASNVVYSLQGESGELVLIEGTGISIDGLTIANSDPGSDQNIFKNIEIGSETISASSNDDTFSLEEGDGVNISASGKTIVFTADNLSGWYKPSTGVVSLLTSSNRVGIGTASPSNTLEIDSGADNTSGITFSRLTSASPVGIGGGKVLSVDSGGKLILVTDQTGGSAEDILPTADTGGTLFFNGTNWVSTTNLYHNDGQVGISNTNPQGRFHLNTNSASSIGAIFQGYSGQTANLMEWRNSAGSVLSYIDSNGIFNGSANVEGSLNPGLTLGQITFQGANGLTGSNNLFWDNDTGRLGVGTSLPAYTMHIQGSGGYPLYVQNTSGGSGIQVAKFLHDVTSKPALDIVKESIKIGMYTDVTLFVAGYNSTLAHRVGIADINPDAHLEVSANGGLTDYFMLSSNDDTDGDVFIVKNSGNIGIGTTEPASILDINAGANGKILVRGATSTLYLGEELGGVNIGSGTNGLGAIRIGRNMNINGYNGNISTGTYGLTLAYTGSNSSRGVSLSTQGQDRLFVTHAGNVGIGTTTPSSYLDIMSGTNNIFKVSDDGTATSISLYRMNDNYEGIYRYLAQYQFPSNGGSFMFGESASNAFYGNKNLLSLRAGSPEFRFIDNAAAGNGFNLKLTAGDFILESSEHYDQENQVERFIIKNDTGNVGLGTTTPSSKLHLYTDASSGNGPTLSFELSDDNVVAGQNYGAIDFISNDIEATGTRARIAGYSSGTSGHSELRFFTAGSGGSVTEAMRVTASGNLGLGGISPATRLSLGTGGGTNISDGTYSVNGHGLLINLEGSGSDGANGYAFGLQNIDYPNSGQTAPHHGAFIRAGRLGPAPSYVLRTQNYKGDDVLVVRGDGTSSSVGIGTTTPEAGLEIRDKGAVFKDTGVDVDLLVSRSTWGQQPKIALYNHSGTATGGNIGELMFTTGNNYEQFRTGLRGIYVGSVGRGLELFQNDSSLLSVMQGLGNMGGIAAINKNVSEMDTTVRFEILEDSGWYTTNRYGQKISISSNLSTSVGALSTYGLYINNAANRAAGENELTNVGLYVNAANGQNNYAAIFENGKVGIGTIDPASSLELNGNLGLSGKIGDAFRVTLANDYALDQNSSGDTFLNAAGGRSISFRINNANQMVLSASGNIGLNTTTFGTNAAKVLAISGSTAPTTGITDGIQLYAIDQGGLGHELVVMDENTNETVLSPHNFSLIPDGRSEDMAWAFYSKRGDLSINADMTKALRLVEGLTGEQLIWIKDTSSGSYLKNSFKSDSKLSLASTQESTFSRLQDLENRLSALETESASDSAKESLLEQITAFAQQVVFQAKAVFQGSVEFLANVTFRGKVSVSQDTAGTVVVPVGARTVRVSFNSAFSQVPVVYLSSSANLNGGYILKEVTEQYFVLELSETQISDTAFNWLAVMQVDGEGARVEVLDHVESEQVIEPEPEVAGGSTENLEEIEDVVEETEEPTEPAEVVEMTPEPEELPAESTQSAEDGE